MPARNLSDLEQRLGRLDLVFVNGEENRPHALWAGRRIPRRELIHFGFHLEELMNLTARGLVKLHTATYPLENVNDAIQDLNNGNLRGRGILIPEGAET